MPSEDWYQELESLWGRASERKSQLFAIACCRRAWALMTDIRHRAVVEVAEQVADGVLKSSKFLPAAMDPVVELWSKLPPATTVEWDTEHYLTGATRHLGSSEGAPYAASFVRRGMARAVGLRDSDEAVATSNLEGVVQVQLFHDILGPKSRPEIVPTSWRTEHTVGIASKMYDDREFAAMPILADALEEAGCDDADVLNHCRMPGVHVRGCWVVDLVLGKS